MTVVAPSVVADLPVSLPMLEPWRCAGCGRLVAKIADVKGRIEIRCRCGTMNVLVIR